MSSRRMDRPLILIPAAEREAIKTICNDRMLHAGFSCSRGVTQRIHDTRSESGCRKPIADRPVDVIADLLECGVDLDCLDDLNRAWQRGTQRLIDLARAQQDNGRAA